MAAVADHAGVTRRAVYLHFATRADLAIALFDHVGDIEDLSASLELVWTAPPAAAWPTRPTPTPTRAAQQRADGALSRHCGRSGVAKRYSGVVWRAHSRRSA